jgi:lysophospholipase L1-like esterase
MGPTISEVTKYRALWLGCVPFLPLVAVQGQRLMKRIPRLPEAAGARSGLAGAAYPGHPLSIVVLGESTAVGVGVETHAHGVSHHLASILRARLDRCVRWRVVGRNGATLAKVEKHWRSESEREADAAVVLLGVNDTMRLTSERRWASGARALATALREGGVRRVVFSALPPVQRFPSLPNPLRTVMGTRAKLLDAILREVVSELPGASYAPVHFASDPGYVATDGFHPSERGYAEWARNLAEHLVPLFERDAAPRRGRESAGLERACLLPRRTTGARSA